MKEKFVRRHLSKEETERMVEEISKSYEEESPSRKKIRDYTSEKFVNLQKKLKEELG